MPQFFKIGSYHKEIETLWINKFSIISYYC